MSGVRLSLVIPCFNEADTLPALVQTCVTLTEAVNAEVILVENGSRDRSADVIGGLVAPHERVRAVLLRENAGYGGGILAGLAAARGSIVGWTHADLQTDPMDAARGLALFEQAPNSFVKGQRVGRPLKDAVFTWGMTAFELAVLGVGMWDINAQPTLFPRDLYASWQDPPTDFSLDLYAFHSAVKARLSIRRFPVTFGDRAAGEGNHDTLAGRLRTVRRTVEYSLKLRRRLAEER